MCTESLSLAYANVAGSKRVERMSVKARRSATWSLQGNPVDTSINKETTNLKKLSSASNYHGGPLLAL